MSDRGKPRGRGRGRGRGRSGTRGDQGGIREQGKVPGQQQHDQGDRDQRGGIQKPGGLKGKEYGGKRSEPHHKDNQDVDREQHEGARGITGGRRDEERGRHDGEGGRGGGRSRNKKQSQDGGRGDHKSNQGEDRQSQISSNPLTLEPAVDFQPSPPHPTDGSPQIGQTLSHQTPKINTSKSPGGVLLTPPKSKESSPGDQDSIKKSSVRKLNVSSQPTPPRSTGSSPGRPEDISKKVMPISSQQIQETTFVFREPPPRPGFGRQGRPIQLVTNHFKLDIPRGFVYHYDVEITPGKCPRGINRQVIWQLQEDHKNALDGCKLAFDGAKNIYTTKKLPSVNGGDRLILKVAIRSVGEEKKREFSVGIKFAATVSLDGISDNYLNSLVTTNLDESQNAIQALDVIMRTMSSMNFTTVGRSFFTPPRDGSTYLGQGREAWFGRYQSVRPSMWGVMLNLDVSATAFYKEQPVLEFLSEIVGGRGDGGGRGGGGRGGGGRGGGGRGGGGRGGGYEDRGRYREAIVPEDLLDYERKKFAKEIKGLRVVVTHLSYPRKYKVKDVTREPASKLSFDLEGKQCTVEDYFKTVHKRDLKYPNLPCLHMEGKMQHIYIPMELCRVLAQNCNRKLTGDQTTAMIRATAKPARERRREILGKLQEAQFDKDPLLHHFGITVNSQLAKIKGRVLDPPKVLYKNDRTVTPTDGAWDMRRDKFYDGIRVEKWAIVVFPSFKYFGEDYLRNFVSKLCRASTDCGMQMAEPTKVRYFNPRDDVKSVFEMLHSEVRDLQLIVAILDKGTNYNEVKRVGDNFIGTSTQCVLSKNASKANPATMGNICLKINMKLGGKNSIIDPSERIPICREPVIMIGADVTHPAPMDKRSPSIAAITASMDQYAMDYRAVAKVLKHRQEVMKIDQLAGIVKDMLIKFYRKTDHKPRRIIFYRDGVSEGQFKEVILNEIAAVQKACLSLDKDYKPGITFLVVQKRHHTRLFCADIKDEHGRGRNVPPGTTVDSSITHPREFDFFLCSHAGIQGTSRPCYYHVLWDDNNFSADDLQTLTYQLCHCYARCNRSVSYPAPTYYSHLAAFRARYHLQDWEEKNGIGSDSMSTMSFSGDELRSLDEMQSAVEVNDQMKDTMYFL